VLLLGSVWFFKHGGLPAPSFLDITLGYQSVPGVEDSGFHQNEQSAAGPYRWTDGKARLVVPLGGKERPQALWVQLHRPKNTWLKITVNNRELVNVEASETELYWWERTIDLNGIDLGRAVVVEIASNPLSARDGDSRTLGVKVRGVKLLSAGDGEKGPPGPAAFLDVPLGARFVPGVEEGGFFDQELLDGQPCRWTNGSARLTVPLGGQKPRALAITAWVPVTTRPEYRVQVTVNGKKLFDDQIAPQSRWKLWSREVPLSGVDLGDRARIELDSSTFVPAKLDPNARDDRHLGIRLVRVMLLTGPAAGRQ
jgi:hypothetical protein